jgi:hypothetical protein
MKRFKVMTKQEKFQLAVFGTFMLAIDWFSSILKIVHLESLVILCSLNCN